MPKLLAFGGPLNEQLYNVDPTARTIYAPVRVKASVLSDLLDPVGPEIRSVRYDVDRIGYRGREWRVLVASGYPRHRVTDQMNAIVGLTKILSL